MSNKRYFWIKLKEDFFEEDAISWIEEQEKGVYYINFYLKLCLKAINNEGILIRKVGEMLIPYDVKSLSKITGVDQDTVLVAMELLRKTGLVEILENGEIYLTQLNLMIGSETKWAEKKRLQRAKGQREDNVPLLSGQCPTDIRDKILDIDIDINKKEKITTIDKLIKEYTTNDNLIETLKDFVKMRKAIKKPLTDRALKGILNKLDKLSENEDIKIKILEQSIENCWAGVFELKNIKTSTNSINQNKNNIPKYKTGAGANVNNSFKDFNSPEDLEKYLREMQKGKGM